MNIFLNALSYFRLLIPIIIGFCTTSVWAVYPDLTHLCSLPNTEYCYTPLLGYGSLARINDPFLFCTEGDPDSNIVVTYYDQEPLTPLGARRRQPLAFYCPLLDGFFCGPPGELGVSIPIAGKTKVTSIAGTKATSERAEETVKIYNPPTFTTWEWFCPCYDTRKLGLWYAVCYDRGHDLRPGRWVNPVFRSDQLPFPH